MALTAFSTSNAYATAVKNYVDGITSVPDEWRRFSEFSTEQSGALRMTSMASIGEVASWDGTADLNSTATAAGAAATKTVDITQYGSQVTISRLDAETIPNLVGGMARRIGVAVANTYSKQVFTTLNNCLSSETSGDGKAFFATNHTVPGNDSISDRTNLVESAVDIAGIAAALKAARQWIDSTGAPYDLSAGGYWLVCSPSVEEAAMQAVMSPYTLTDITTSGSPSQGLSNMVTQYLSVSDIIVSPHISDTNAAFLLPKLQPALMVWQRLAPVLRTTQNEDDLSIRLTVDFALTAACQVEPIGIALNPS